MSNANRVNENLIIRPAKMSDAEAIALVHVNSWRETYAGIISQEFLNMLSVKEKTQWWESVLSKEQERAFCFVAESSKRGVIGFGNSGPDRHPNRDKQGEHYALYVLRDEQRKAVGFRLLYAMQRSLVLQGFSDANVWVLKENVRALAFYKQTGATTVCEDTIMIQGEPLSQILLSWPSLNSWVAANEPIHRNVS
jgi:ribosomal protein S18 acetylase RimI-like enzyme